MWTYSNRYFKTAYKYLKCNPLKIVQSNYSKLNQLHLCKQKIHKEILQNLCKQVLKNSFETCASKCYEKFIRNLCKQVYNKKSFETCASKYPKRNPSKVVQSKMNPLTIVLVNSKRKTF